MSRLGHTQPRVSELTGVSQSNISRLLSGQRKRVTRSVRMLCQYADFNADPAEQPAEVERRLSQVLRGVIGDNPAAAAALTRILEALGPVLRAYQSDVPLLPQEPTMTTPVLADVYRGLKEVGLTKAQVSAILPDWWAPEIASSEAGLWETAVLLGRRLCLDASALVQGRVQQVAEVSPPRYKHTARVTPIQLGPAALIASSLAKAVLGATPNRGHIPPRTASSVREELLAAPNGRIDFDGLLKFCWSNGIPVIPLPKLPKGVRKMDAAAIKVGSRPAIVIALRNNSKAWLSFLLAHELGHICLGHVPENAAIIEGSIGDSTEFDAESQQDAQEMEANAFAHDLLGGPKADELISNWAPSMPAVTMASMAAQQAMSLKTAPGHLILRHAFKTHRWPEARMALNFLADDLDAQASLILKMQQEIDTNAIADDLQDYVEQITGVTPQR